ncbi:MAG: zinc ribbon domain-containing protein [Actinobacteria bacterium]|nr:zinc ribbon domain-containing protein [Actinomycetota bacterium]
MAIYDLKCDDCGKQFEMFVTGFLTDEDRECPRCNSRRVSQKFNSSFGIGSSCSSKSGGGCSTPPSGSFG